MIPEKANENWPGVSNKEAGNKKGCEGCPN